MAEISIDDIKTVDQAIQALQELEYVDAGPAGKDEKALEFQANARVLAKYIEVMAIQQFSEPELKTKTELKRKKLLLQP